MWQSILKFVLSQLFKTIYKQYISPWIAKLKEDKKYQRAIELAGPLIEMAERGELSNLLVGEAKRQAVLDNLKYQLKQEGIELREYLLNSAIEMCMVALTEEGVINK